MSRNAKRERSRGAATSTRVEDVDHSEYVDDDDDFRNGDEETRFKEGTR